MNTNTSSNIEKHIQIVYGAPNVQFTSPNKFTFTMPTPYQSGSHDRIALKNLRLYYSWFNLTQKKNNSAYSYKWLGNYHVVLMPDGIWSYADFLAFLQQTMLANGHYLIDSTGANVFFISLLVNSVYYKISLMITAIPTSLPQGWKAPTGFVFPAVKTTPQLVIPPSNIRQYLGFNEGIYPAVEQATDYNINSVNVPLVTDSSSLMLQCNLAMNEYSPSMNTLATFNVIPGTAPGSLISEIPYYQDWINIQPVSRFSVITLTLVDQNSRPVLIQDPSGFIVTLNIQTK
jgi:hypothetical protein